MNEQIKQFFSLKRRTFVAGMAATSVAFGSSQVFGSSKIKVAGIYTRSATAATIRISASREGGVENIPVHWVAIGEAS